MRVMKLITGLMLSFIIGFIGCTALQKQEARSAIDALSYACVIENATLGNDVVAKICAIENALLPALNELLKQHRMGMAKAAVHCPSAAPAVPAVLDAGKSGG